MAEEEEMGRDEQGGKNKVCQTNLFSFDCLLDYFPCSVSAFFVSEREKKESVERQKKKEVSQTIQVHLN